MSLLTDMEYNENEYGEYYKATTTPRDEKCQLNATHGPPMNDEETLTPLGRLKLTPKQHYTQVQGNSCTYRLQH